MEHELDKYEKLVLICIFRQRRNRVSTVNLNEIIEFFDPCMNFDNEASEWHKKVLENDPDFRLQIKWALNNLVSKEFLEESFSEDSPCPTYQFTKISEDFFTNKSMIMQIANECRITI